MLLWVVGGRRPLKVTGTFHATQSIAPNYADNTLAVMEFEGGGLGIIDISLREHGGHRRFEVFGAKPAVAAIPPSDARRQISAPDAPFPRAFWGNVPPTSPAAGMPRPFDASMLCRMCVIP